MLKSILVPYGLQEMQLTPLLTGAEGPIPPKISICLSSVEITRSLICC